VLLGAAEALVAGRGREGAERAGHGA
jgi:hypothetical protein